ncbi:zinc finger protein 862-like [Dendronephthya gigantea]|uniref:zinc finger protein 862-like n=1 Tax=Dendronephthya gigantea TaxID=151771 RepID=UPI00106AC97A|nr:zinc finger protein 862-like [Dendronephthya gigantea]
MSSKGKDHKAALKTVQRWEKEFGCEFDYDMRDGFVVRIRCKLCTKWESRINGMKNFSTTWIHPGSESVKKHSVQGHTNSIAHMEAKRIEDKSKMGIEAYMNRVVDETPIGQNFKNMCMSVKDRESLRIKFNSAYYLAKQERPFSDFSELLKLQSKNNILNIGESYTTDRAAAQFVNVIGEVTRESLEADLAKARYYSILSDGSTDVSTTEQELVYVLFLQDGTPVVKFAGVESATTADAEGLLRAIESAFSRLGISCFPDRLVGLDVDGASVNMGIHAGLGAKVRESAPWLVLVHCFNHRIELALKDVFDASAFSKIDQMLRVLHALYNASPKRYSEPKQLAEAWQTSIPKPTKATGTRWIEHKVNAMKIALENYGAFLSHIESLSQTDLNPTKRAELERVSEQMERCYISNLPGNLFGYPFSHTSLKFGFSARIARSS